MLAWRGVMTSFWIVFSTGVLWSGPSLKHVPFDSEAERVLFEAWQNERKLPIPLATALLVSERVDDPAEQEQFLAKLAQIAEKLKNKSGGNPVKSAKAVYKYLHKDQILHYQELAQFKDVLNMGASYNCVTSTALFTTLCRELEIPVQLYVTPNHVFCTVNANGKEVRIEMTDPRKGFGFKTGIKESLDYLKRYKLVTDQEFKQKGERIIYREFVDLAKPIPDAYLLAISYYNQAAAHANNKRHQAGMYAIAKSLLINPEAPQSLALMENAIVGFMTSYGIAEQPLSSYIETAGLAVDFLPEEKDFLNRMLNTLLHTVQTYHGEASAQDLEDFIINMIVIFKDYPPLKQKINAFRGAIQP